MDGIGGFMAYGLIDNSHVVQAEGLLPIGLSEGCRLKHDLFKDSVIRYADVALPENRLCDKLRAEQDSYFSAVVAPRAAAR